MLYKLPFLINALVNTLTYLLTDDFLVDAVLRNNTCKFTVSFRQDSE